MTADPRDYFPQPAPPRPAPFVALLGPLTPTPQRTLADAVRGAG